MDNNYSEQVNQLEGRAKAIHSFLSYAPRAFVVEFSGTPKSGKSTSVEAIRHFFARHQFRVHVLAERAAVCPIPMKGHLFFNTWCATSMLAELLANVETETDIIIVDRGLFDSLVWMTMQEDRGELTAQEARTIEGFLLLDRWCTLTDLAVVMSVSPDEALSRENAQRITTKSGSIMNRDVLTAIITSVEKSIKKYSPRFRGVIHHDTTGLQVRQSNIYLAENILDQLEQFLNPEILVVPRQELSKLVLRNGGAFGDSAINEAHDCIRKYGTFIRRANAEKSSEYVQIAPCAILFFENQVFLFQRKEADPKSRLYGKTTILRGCHVSKRSGVDLPELLQQSLQDKVSGSLHLSRVFGFKAQGFCWDRENEYSKRHFGVIYKIVIDNPHTAVDLKKKEFRKQRGHDLIGSFVSGGDVRARQEELNLENWSRTILRNLVI